MTSQKYIETILTKDILSKEYAKTKSLLKLASYFGFSKDTILDYLKKFNLHEKQRGEYYCNHDVFKIESEESFYWAGFIAADGCLKQKTNSYSLYIGLSIKDKEHLIKFQKFMNTNYPIRDYLVKNSKRNPKWNDTYKSEINITSKSIYDDLQKFNITQRKTKTFKLNDYVLNHKYINHFIRGYFDGDGSIYNSDNTLFVNFRGTKEALNQIHNCFNDNNILSNTKPRLNSGIYTLEYGGNIITKKICEFLYKDATIYLPRKYEKAKHVLK